MGESCYTSMGPIALKLRKESFPFDNLGTTIEGIYEVLKLLSTDSLNIEEFCTIVKKKEFEDQYGPKRSQLRNKWGMFLIHYVPNDLDNPNHQYKYKEGETIVDVFTRRFERLKQKFFHERNLLIYQDLGDLEFEYKTITYIEERKIQCFKNILDLNNNNHFLYITYKKNINNYEIPKNLSIIHPNVETWNPKLNYNYKTTPPTWTGDYTTNHIIECFKTYIQRN